MSEPSALGGDNGAVNTPETFVRRETWQLQFEVANGYRGDIEVTLTSI